MLKIIKNRLFLNIFLLFFLAGFLIFPKIILANDFQDITIKEASEYLELPEDKVEGLIHSLINIFHSKWEDLMVYGQPTADQMAVPNIMKNVVRTQAMNYLLIDAPMDIAWDMVNGGIKLARIFLANDLSGILNDLEKESVKKAVDYGLNILLQEGIKMTPGAIEFKYTLRDDTEATVVIQYIVIYKPLNKEEGKLVIKFYSPKSIKPPKNKGSVGSLTGFYTELIKDLPPFTVNIKGSVKNYRWTKTPSMDIEFPKSVPDFGIEPIGFWEKHLIKPVEKTIKEVDIIITKVTGETAGIVNIWEKIKNETKKFISDINPFSPAALVEIPQINTYPTESVEDKNQQTEKSDQELVEDQPQRAESLQQTEKSIQKPVNIEPQQLSLIEMQEILDDISEKINNISEEIIALNMINEDENNEEKNKEESAVEDNPQQTGLCSKDGLPSRNKVIFNEIAWMGTENSANDEWIELKNISGGEIDLTGWRILNGNNNINILFATGTILQNDYFLLERTNDDSVSDIFADLIYTGALKNTSETLYLFDKNCQMQDMISDLPQWNYGDNQSKQTMERKLDLTWQTSKNAEGTPKAENSQGYTVVFNSGSPSPAPTPVETVEESPQQTICSYKDGDYPIYSPVIFNEIAWMGSASNSADEWIELKNISTSTVSLNNWQLIGENSETNENKVEIIFNENNAISENDYFLLERKDDKSVPSIEANRIFTGTINDSNFILRLFNEGCSLIDEIIATSTWPAGQKEPERKTMEREINLNWHTSYSTSSINDLFGTPKAENSQKQEELTKENQIPIALFDYQPQNPIINQEIIFNTSSSTDVDGTIISYNWIFGDGNSTTTEKATTTYKYSTSSSYIVSLQIIDNTNATSTLATSSITISLEEIPTLEVVINEIAWMGTSATNPSDEWIELYNNTTSTIDLAGWKILKNGEDFIKFSTSTDKTIKLTTSTILAQEFYLLERTDDDSVSDIFADLIYVGALNNNGEILELRDNNGVLIDTIDCSSGWFAGTTTLEYISMERINSFSSGTSSENWANNNIINRNGRNTDNELINGTPKEENSVSQTDTQIESLPFNEFNEITLTYLGNPYIIVNSLTVPNNKTLIIEPGVTLKFQDPVVTNQGPRLEIEGNLIAIGKEGKKIKFIPVKNRWSGILFTGGNKELNTSSKLELVEIENSWGRKNNNYCAIIIEEKSVLIKNSIIKYYSKTGIKLINSNSIIDNVKFLGGGTDTSLAAIDIQKGSPIIKNCNAIEKNQYGINIAGLSQNDLPIIENNTFNNNKLPIYSVNPNITVKNNKGDNTENKIRIWGNIYKDTIWFSNEFPYTTYYIKIFPEVTLTISSGTNWHIEHEGTIDVEGIIVANGSLKNMINIYTRGSYNPKSYIYLNSATNTSIFKNTIINREENSGSGQAGIAIEIHSTNAEFENVFFNNNSATGLYLNNSQIVKIKNSYFKENRIGLKIQNSLTPLLTNTIFENNSKADIYWPSGGDNCENLKINSELKIECSCCPY